MSESYIRPLALCKVCPRFRDWSLITGSGGIQKMGGGGDHTKFCPYEKGGGAEFFNHAEGGGAQNVFRVVFMR